MTRFQTSVCLLLGLLLTTATGCGSNTPESLLKQQLNLMNDMADAMEKGDTDALKTFKEKSEALGKKMKDATPSPEEMKRLQEKYAAKMQEVSGRLAAAAMKQAPRAASAACPTSLPYLPCLPCHKLPDRSKFGSIDNGPGTLFVAHPGSYAIILKDDRQYERWGIPMPQVVNSRANYDP